MEGDWERGEGQGLGVSLRGPNQPFAVTKGKLRSCNSSQVPTGLRPGRDSLGELWSSAGVLGVGPELGGGPGSLWKEYCRKECWRMVSKME